MSVMASNSHLASASRHSHTVHLQSSVTFEAWCHRFVHSCDGNKTTIADEDTGHDEVDCSVSHPQCVLEMA